VLAALSFAIVGLGAYAAWRKPWTFAKPSKS
jgi:hypothetical protein